jgi:hypothetical protein
VLGVASGCIFIWAKTVPVKATTARMVMTKSNFFPMITFLLLDKIFINNKKEKQTEFGHDWFITSFLPYRLG